MAKPQLDGADQALVKKSGIVVVKLNRQPGGMSGVFSKGEALAASVRYRIAMGSRRKWRKACRMSSRGGSGVGLTTSS